MEKSRVFTTIRIDPELWKQVRIEATKRNVTRAVFSHHTGWCEGCG